MCSGEKFLHVDVLRKFHTRINALGVLCYDADPDDVQLATGRSFRCVLRRVRFRGGALKT